MNNDEMYNSRTVRLGKYLDEPTADDEIETAKNLAATFGFIFELEMFNQEDRWLSIKITYPRDELFSNEFSSVVKFFALYHQYAILYYSDGVRPLFDESE